MQQVNGGHVRWRRLVPAGACAVRCRLGAERYQLRLGSQQGIGVACTGQDQVEVGQGFHGAADVGRFVGHQLGE